MSRVTDGVVFTFLGVDPDESYRYRCTCGHDRCYVGPLKRGANGVWSATGTGASKCMTCDLPVVHVADKVAKPEPKDVYAKWRSPGTPTPWPIEAAVKKLSGSPTFSPVETRWPANHPKAGQPTSCLYHVKGIPQKEPIVIYGPCDEDVP